jgi:hypothetical protein
MNLPRVSVFQSAMRERMTWGSLPSHAAFRDAYWADLGDKPYEIRNCRKLDAVYPNGNVDLNCDELWAFLNECSEHGFDTNHELSDVCSAILYTLGFEWV